ncbi:hypothetical protein T439DRAFT_324547 [Meredithblackwellia eburnea MCA 4105]
MTNLYPLPAEAQRPRFRWWWPAGFITPSLVEHQLQDLAKRGFGGAEIANLALGSGRPTMESELMHGCERWNAGVLAAFKEANRLGLQLDLTIGPLWPCMIPGLLPDSPDSAKELTGGIILLQPGQHYRGTLPIPADPPAGLSPSNFDAVSTLNLLGVSAVLVTGDPDDNGVVEVEDLADGSLAIPTPLPGAELEWTAPAAPEGSKWALVACYYRGTAQTKSSFEYNDSKYTSPVSGVVDHLSKEGVTAIKHYYESTLLSAELLELFKSAPQSIRSNLFEDSLELAQAQYFTPSLLSRFQSRHGYSLVPHLPTLLNQKKKSFFHPRQPVFASRAPSPGKLSTAERVKHDFLSTVSDLYIHNRLESLVELSHGMSMSFRNQPYGLPIDAALAAYTVDVPEGETLCFHSNLDAFRLLVAGRDVRGTKVLSTELLANIGGDWKTTWADVVREANAHFAVGVNQIMLHGLPYTSSPTSTWPGYFPLLPNPPIPGFAEAWGELQPQWEFASSTSAYLSRCMSILQRGQSVVDLAIYHPPLLNIEAKWDDSDLSNLGFSYSFVTDGLLELPGAKVVDGQLTWVGSSTAYKALIINNQSSLSFSLTKILHLFAKSGLPIVIVGSTPNTIPGFSQTLSEDEKLVQECWAEIIKCPTVRVVGSEQRASQAMGELELRPSVKYSNPSTGLIYTHRREPATESNHLSHWYFFFNRSSESVSTSIMLDGVGSCSSVNAWDGRILPLPTSVPSEGVTSCQITVGGSEAVILVVRKSEELPRPVVSESLVPLSDWTLSLESWTAFDPSAIACPIHKTKKTPLPPMKLNRLRPWLELPEGRDVSGVGSYVSSFVLPDVSTFSSASLVLPCVSNGTAGVSINGNKVAVDILGYTSSDITAFVKGGENKVVVTVTSTLNNVMRVTMPALYEKRERSPYGMLEPPIIQVRSA